MVTYDGALDVRVPPTNRIEPVLTALEEAMSETARGAQLDLEVRGLLRVKNPTTPA
ncbi:MAG: hypothetical protein OES47_14000 [Acidobacteriota bacterium]|nr:hypothetical protein [Acidobacteriota bacterium]